MFSLNDLRIRFSRWWIFLAHTPRSKLKLGGEKRVVELEWEGKRSNARFAERAADGWLL